MRLSGISLPALVISLLAALVAGGCHEADDNALPAYPVSIDLGNTGLWNVYGVSGFGIHRSFVLASGVRIPEDFPYRETSRTGFGGVLLIGGMDPYTGDTNVPLAYDLACPVEKRPDVRVAVDEATTEAVCPVCGSRFDVTMAGGSPLSGPAASKKRKVAMTRYRCLPTVNGGYLISN